MFPRQWFTVHLVGEQRVGMHRDINRQASQVRLSLLSRRRLSRIEAFKKHLDSAFLDAGALEDTAEWNSRPNSSAHCAVLEWVARHLRFEVAAVITGALQSDWQCLYWETTKILP